MTTTTSPQGAGRAIAALPVLALLAAATVLAAGPLYRWSVLDLREAFGLMRWGFYAAAAVAGLSLVALVAAAIRRRRRAVPPIVLALVIAAVPTIGLLQFRAKAAAVPPIHDVTTDLDDPPAFAALHPRADERTPVVPARGRADLAGLPAIERWRVYHREAYGDLAPLRLGTDPADAIALAERAARDLGWEIAAVDPRAGRLEATDTTFWFGFRDDVAVRVRPDSGDGGDAGTVRLDVRSVSRVGISDLGANAARIERFLDHVRRLAGERVVEE